MPKNVIMPALGVAQETGRVLNWLKKDSEQVIEGELLLEIETDKATVELDAPASGILRDVTASAGDEVPVGTIIARIWTAEDTANTEEKPATEFAQTRHVNSTSDLSRQLPDTATHVHTTPPSDSIRNRVPASPKARRLASERESDLNSLVPSDSRSPLIAPSVDRSASPGFASSRTPGRVWRIMAERMEQAWKNIPHFYLVRELDASNLIAWRESLRSSPDQITYTDLIVKNVAGCLRDHPHLRSEWKSGEVEQHDEINIGIAVATDDGLVVPVIRNVDKIAIEEVAKRRKQLVESAQAGRLTPQELSRGIFTISNLGMYGVDSFQAIVNPPQAAILSVGRIAPRVVPVKDQPAVRYMITLGLTCDHRLVDGTHAARFLGELARSLEQDPTEQG
jgi:pyruvate dehydrogenase E2 component (dihydrolipoamide acetyltransferase)